MFPIFNLNGHAIGFGGRLLPDGSAKYNSSVGKFKYVNSPTSPGSQHLYFSFISIYITYSIHHVCMYVCKYTIS